MGNILTNLPENEKKDSNADYNAITFLSQNLFQSSQIIGGFNEIFE